MRNLTSGRVYLAGVFPPSSMAGATIFDSLCSRNEYVSLRLSCRKEDLAFISGTTARLDIFEFLTSFLHWIIMSLRHPVMSSSSSWKLSLSFCFFSTLALLDGLGTNSREALFLSRNRPGVLAELLSA